MPELVPYEQKAKNVQALIQKMAPEFGRVLSKSVTPERFVRVALTQVRRIPKLAECDPMSLIGAFMEAAQLNLEVGVNGQAWVLPFKQEATLVLGYKGLVDLAYRSGQVIAVFADCVYEGDLFDWERGTTPFIRHKPCGAEDPKTITHAYAIIETVHHGKPFEVVTRAAINKVRARAPSTGASRSPWVTDFPAMCKKTAVKLVCKLAPASPQLRRAIELDDMAELGQAQHLGDVVDVEYTKGNGAGSESVRESKETTGRADTETVSEGPAPTCPECQGVGECAPDCSLHGQEPPA
jgi:recombination protein RecT